MQTSSSGTTLAFLGIHEPFVDQVLEHLRDLTRLPRRCLVFSSNAQMLGALVKQWEGEIEIVAAIALLPIVDMMEGIELIAESEGLDPRQVLWVGGGSDLGHLPRKWRRVVVNERAEARAAVQPSRGI